MNSGRVEKKGFLESLMGFICAGVAPADDTSYNLDHPDLRDKKLYGDEKDCSCVEKSSFSANIEKEQAQSTIPATGKFGETFLLAEDQCHYVCVGTSWIKCSPGFWRNRHGQQIEAPLRLTAWIHGLYSLIDYGVLDEATLKLPDGIWNYRLRSLNENIPGSLIVNEGKIYFNPKEQIFQQNTRFAFRCTFRFDGDTTFALLNGIEYDLTNNPQSFRDFVEQLKIERLRNPYVRQMTASEIQEEKFQKEERAAISKTKRGLLDYLCGVSQKARYEANQYDRQD